MPSNADPLTFLALETPHGQLRAYLQPPDHHGCMNPPGYVYFRVDCDTRPKDPIWFNLKLSELADRSHWESISTRWDRRGFRIASPYWGDMFDRDGAGLLLEHAWLEQLFAWAREEGALDWPPLAVISRPSIRLRASVLAEHSARMRGLTLLPS